MRIEFSKLLFMWVIYEVMDEVMNQLVIENEEAEDSAMQVLTVEFDLFNN